MAVFGLPFLGAGLFAMLSSAGVLPMQNHRETRRIWKRCSC